MSGVGVVVGQVVSRQYDGDGRVVLVVGMTPDYFMELLAGKAAWVGPEMAHGDSGGVLLVAAADDESLISAMQGVFDTSAAVVDAMSMAAWEERFGYEAAG